MEPEAPILVTSFPFLGDADLAAMLIVIVSLAAQRRMPAQVFDFKIGPTATIELHGLWCFHTGDDPGRRLGCAAPAFDDSTWKLLRSDSDRAVFAPAAEIEEGNPA